MLPRRKSTESACDLRETAGRPGGPYGVFPSVQTISLWNEGVAAANSSGLGHLISAFTSVRKKQGDLKLLNLRKNAQGLMQMTKLYTVFDIKDDEAAAVKAFGRSSAAPG